MADLEPGAPTFSLLVLLIQTGFLICGLAKKLFDMSSDPRERQWLHQRLFVAVTRGNAARILACVKFDLTSSVIFLVSFNVLISIAACHLPLCQCIAIAFRILVLSVSFIAPLVVQCYLVQCHLAHFNLSCACGDVCFHDISRTTYILPITRGESKPERPGTRAGFKPI